MDERANCPCTCAASPTATALPASQGFHGLYPVSAREQNELVRVVATRIGAFSARGAVMRGTIAELSAAVLTAGLLAGCSSPPPPTPSQRFAHPWPRSGFTRNTGRRRRLPGRGGA